MYKTVRHGENSLQYTILPQQEEGAVSIRPRKSKKRGKTAAVLTVTIILICGVIATAVLVPLLLTSDLVALPAAFQKFSVSTVHRSQFGNHYRAKKPHDWNPPSRTSTTPPPMTIASKPENTTKEAIISVTNPSTATTTSTSTTSTTTSTTTTTTTPAPLTVQRKKAEPIYEKTTPEGIETTKLAEQEVTENDKPDESPSRYADVFRKNYIRISTTTLASQSRDIIGDGMIVVLGANMRSTSSPWSHRRWPFSDTATYFRWSDEVDFRVNVLLPIILVGTVVTICVIIVVACCLGRRRCCKRSLNAKSGDTKAGDKATLLRDTAVASEEE